MAEIPAGLAVHDDLALLLVREIDERDGEFAEDVGPGRSSRLEGCSGGDQGEKEGGECGGNATGRARASTGGTDAHGKPFYHSPRML
jgi:hypothetical protein